VVYNFPLGSTGRLTITSFDGLMLADTGTVEPCAIAPVEPEVPGEPEVPVVPEVPADPDVVIEPVGPTLPDGAEATAPVADDRTAPIASPATAATALANSSSADAPGTLPTTGSGSWIIAAIASVLTTAGIAMVTTSRRRTIGGLR
jgi:hypothetical protein